MCNSLLIVEVTSSVDIVLQLSTESEKSSGSSNQGVGIC